MLRWSTESFLEYLASPYMLQGVWVTVWLTVVSMVLGISVGFVACLMKMSRNVVLRSIGSFYIWLWRATPLLVQLVLIYTGLPQLGIRFTVVQSALIGLSLNEGAYFAEILRAGILSVDKSQGDAARALGMTPFQAMRIVVLPQAFRIILPPLGNQFNGMLKTSSLASVVSMEELLRHAQMLAQVEFRVLEAYLAAAVYYALLTTLWGRVQTWIEIHFGKPYANLPAERRPRNDEVPT